MYIVCVNVSVSGERAIFRVNICARHRPRVSFSFLSVWEERAVRSGGRHVLSMMVSMLLRRVPEEFDITDRWYGARARWLFKQGSFFIGHLSLFSTVNLGGGILSEW